MQIKFEAKELKEANRHVDLLLEKQKEMKRKETSLFKRLFGFLLK